MANREGSFVFPVADLEVRFIRPRLARGGVHSGVWSDVAVSHGGAHVHEARYNLSSLTSRRELAKYLASRAELPKPLNWTDAIETAATLMCREMHKGKAATHIADCPNPAEPSYLVKPLLLRDKLTIFYGEGEGAKSLVAVALAYCVSTGEGDLLGLTAQGEAVNYLDWETDDEEIARRTKRFAAGLGFEVWPDFNYFRMDVPLVDDTETMRNLAPGFTIIDSLGPACGGDTIRPEGPTNFWNTVRRLQGTVLVIAQTQKDGPKKTIFGSGMFHYMARSVWEAVNVVEDGTGTIHLAMFHRKSNVGRHWPPMAWRFEFDDTACTTLVRPEQLAAIPEMTSHLSVQDQIAAVLRGGSRTVGDICAEADLKENTVRGTLRRYRSRFVKNGEQWGLLSNR